MTTQKKCTENRFSHGLILLTVFVVIQLWASHLVPVDSRPLPSQALVIQQEPVSPSWAAFEDIWDPPPKRVQAFFLPSGQGIRLLAGQETMPRERWIKKVKQPAVPALYEPLQGMIISQSQLRQTAIQVATTRLQLQPRVAASRLAQKYVSADLAEPSSFEQKAQQLVQQELLRRQEEAKKPKVRRIPVASGGHIVVASANTPQSAASLIKQPLETRKQPYVLSGHFTLGGGLAYVAGAMKFKLYHILNDVSVTEGMLWEDQARFEINVKELKGQLVLRLVDREGNILGVNQVQLQSLTLPSKNQKQIAGLNINLKPVPVGATAELISAYSIGNQTVMPVAKAQVEIDGLNRHYQSNEEGAIDDPDVLPGSSFILKAQHKSFWGSLAVGLSGQHSTLQLFPEKMVEALLGLVARNDDEYEDLSKKGVIWGRVVQNGEPLAGVVVELAGRFDISPIYLNDIYLPDQNMEGTGRTGLFAFVGVASGIQSVRAIVKGAPYPAKVVPVENYYVSPLELEVGQPTVATVKVTKAPMRNQPYSATFHIVGTDREYRVEGEAAIQWPKGSGLMLVEADGGEEMDVIRISLERESSEISVPMIPSRWLQQLATEKRINLEGQKGVVVGFVNGKNFQVFLDDKQPYGHENTIYFDKSGKIVRDGTGPAGGGFILFNVPIGLRSINVIPFGSDRIFTRTIIVEAAVTNVIPEVSL